MTDIDLDKLEALADRCMSGDPWYKEGDLCGRQTFGQFLTQDRAFIAAANPATIKSLIASAREAAAEIERLRGRFTELADDFERRADTCHDLIKPGWEQRDLMRLHGKEAAYRHAMMLARAAQMDGEG